MLGLAGGLALERGDVRGLAGGLARERGDVPGLAGGSIALERGDLALERGDAPGLAGGSIAQGGATVGERGLRKTRCYDLSVSPRELRDDALEGEVARVSIVVCLRIGPALMMIVLSSAQACFQFRDSRIWPESTSRLSEPR